MDRQILAGMLIGVAVISGCVSIDKTKAQLASSNQADVKKGEEAIYDIAMTAEGWYRTSERIEFINLSSNSELMDRIASNTKEPKIFEAALSKIDFTKPGVGMKYLQLVFEKRLEMYREGRYDGKQSYWEYLQAKEGGPRTSIGMPSVASRGAGGANQDGMSTKKLASMLVSGMTEDEVLQLLAANKDQAEIRWSASLRAVKVVNSPETLFKMLTGEIAVTHWYAGQDLRVAILKKIGKLAKSINDEKLVIAMMKNPSIIGDKPIRSALIGKLSEATRVELALEMINKYTLEQWDSECHAATHVDEEEDDAPTILRPMNSVTIDYSIEVASSLKDSSLRTDVVNAILSKLEGIRMKCKDPNKFYNWPVENEQCLNDVINRIPKLSAEEYEDVFCREGNAWGIVAALIPAESVTRLLKSGNLEKAREEMLAEKVMSDAIDLDMYNAVKSEKAQKMLVAKMPESVKQEMQANLKKQVDAIIAKAKDAAADTFEAHGFYLGMSIDDAKALFIYYFPDYYVELKRSGDSSDSDWGLYVGGQVRPFCRGELESRRVWRFDFGESLLKKWYKYDAGTYMKWARTYAAEHGIDMELDFLDKDGNVYFLNAMGEMEPYYASFNQEIYRYRNGSKGYIITYYGEPKITTVGGGAFAKAAAKDKFMEGEAGTLRVTIDE